MFDTVFVQFDWRDETVRRKLIRFCVDLQLTPHCKYAGLVYVVLDTKDSAALKELLTEQNFTVL